MSTEDKSKQKLDELRDDIQQIDDEMLKLLARRIDLAEDVYRQKRELVKNIYDAGQEESKLAAAAESENEQIRRSGPPLLSALMRLSRERQYALARPDSLDWSLGKMIAEGMKKNYPVQVVATQGNAYSYSAKAATKLFPGRAYIPHRTFEEAILSVVRGQTDAAVLPLENSAAGTVDDVYQLIQSTNLFITDAMKLGVRHHLLVPPGMKIEDIQAVTSHRQALAQCSRIIKERGWLSVEALNTAFAAEDVASCRRPGMAAIATADAAEAYGLEIADLEVSNTKENQTRFVVVRRNLQITEKADTLSLLIRLPHSAGSLVSVMNIFSDYGVNLSKIQSIPIPRNPWEYYFYLDCETKPADETVLDILYQLEHESTELRLLGWYCENESLK